MCEVLCVETIIYVKRGKYSGVYEINELNKVHDHWSCCIRGESFCVSMVARSFTVGIWVSNK
jgi:hypothetical protein